jgi:hypothetical protein
MFNAFIKLYNFSSLSPCSMLEVVEFDENIEHVKREETL